VSFDDEDSFNDPPMFFDDEARERRQRRAFDRLARRFGEAVRASMTPEERAARDAFHERHLALCDRLTERARSDGLQIPSGSFPFRYFGPLDQVSYMVVVNQRPSEPIPAADATEDYLYTVYKRMLGEAGIRGGRFQ
jgi:hypothetical protein